MNQPLRIGIIGMGGFAGVHHDAALKLEQAGLVRVVCGCDPAMEKFAQRRQALRFDERGVRTFGHYLEMLDACRDELDFVTIPTPIPLHAAMHKACVERSLPVYLEKPPTLDWRELEAMLAVEHAAKKLTNVGFNFIIEGPRQEVKRRLVAGEFGHLEVVKLFALWPRGKNYYARANWAGRLELDGRCVLDSPVGNAMAHQTHNALFWCGRGDLWAWGEVGNVRAQLYRAHEIQGADTFFLKAAMEGGTQLWLAMTHACTGAHMNQEQVQCSLATITCPTASALPITIAWKDGRTETLPQDGRGNPVENLRAYAQYCRGEAPRPMTRLIDSRPFVELNDLCYIAAGRIQTLREPARRKTASGGDELVTVDGLEEAVRQFLAGGQLPDEQHRPWAYAGGSAGREDLPKLQTAVAALAAETGG